MGDYGVEFGPIGWNLVLDGNSYLVVRDEPASEPMESALTFDYEKHVKGKGCAFGWSVVSLRSTDDQCYHFLYVFRNRTRAASTPELVLDPMVSIIEPNRICETLPRVHQRACEGW